MLAGDVFDLFVGHKEPFLSRYTRALHAIRAATERGVRLDYIEGNHDFWIGPVFGKGKMKNSAVHKRELILEQAGRRIFIGHGDLVDRSDVGYLLLRLFFRSPFFGAFVKLAPGSWIDWIGKRLSVSSQAKNVRWAEDLPEERQASLRKTYRGFAEKKFSEGFDGVILGHCHDLDETKATVNTRACEYFNMGFPPKHGTYLVARDGKLSRERF